LRRSSASVGSVDGFEQADQLAGESVNPKRDIPRAVIGSVLIGIIIIIHVEEEEEVV
jgi:amino acid transporter